MSSILMPIDPFRPATSARPRKDTFRPAQRRADKIRSWGSHGCRLRPAQVGSNGGNPKFFAPAGVGMIHDCANSSPDPSAQAVHPAKSSAARRKWLLIVSKQPLRSIGNEIKRHG